MYVPRRSIGWWASKPPHPIALNRDPMLHGLLAAFVAMPGGTKIVDLLGGGTMSLLSTATWDLARGGFPGLRCDAADEGAEFTTPAKYKLGWPLSIVWRGYVLGAPSTQELMFGITHNNADTAPFHAFGLANATGPHWSAFMNDGTTFNELSMVTAPVTGTVTSLAATVAVGGAQVGYVNGKVTATGSITGSGPAYGASSVTCFGDYTGVVRTSNVIHDYGFIFRRVLLPAEVRRFVDQPYWWAARTRAQMLVTGQTESMSAATMLIPAWA